MYLSLLKSKLHMARVTEARLDYEGSITIDTDLIEKVAFVENEKVLVADVDNGNRFETYVIPGERGSGVICINGAAARLCGVGDRVIIMSFCMVDKEDAATHRPFVQVLDEQNKPKGGLK